MGVGAERVGELDTVEQVAVLGAQRGDPGPGGVDVHPGAVLAGEGGDGADGVDGAGAGGADGRAHQHRAQARGDVVVQLRGEHLGDIATVPGGCGEGSTTRSARLPSPATRAALATDECVSAVT